MSEIIAIAKKFLPQETITNIQEYGSGNINNTFLVTTDSAEEPYYILQRLNTKVFSKPELVMDNICLVSEHIIGKLSPNDCWRIPRILLTENRQHHYLDSQGCFWRAMSFIDNALCLETVQNLEQAQEIGYGLGMFHRLISDLPVHQLGDTLPGFHITPSYLKNYYQVQKTVSIASSVEVNYGFNFIKERAKSVGVLETAKAQGILPIRPIHGDPKINNILLERDSKKAVAMIDLDTVKPGLIHYDLGDCLRSGCNLSGEETPNWEQVKFDTEIAREILQGYLAIAQDFLTDYDYQYFYDGIRLIAFELGLRFFTDYLAGNLYFKTDYPEHNLIRALVQFKLTESIENQQAIIRKIIFS
ncbi:MAG: aminoglycoside phosphotransferase family protein [Xenococcaceae cyanobacterium MO_167.B27]|nr:aminoglycoside phosphotransferase family protein [Xenococcaceae cyanobacterium MO_167.B27]